MWPKVFAQLVEQLLPHVHHLIPVADKLLTSRSSDQRLIEGSLAESVHGDLGQITASNASLYRQLQDQSAQIAEVATEAHRARMVIESSAERIVALEKQVATMGLWVKSCVLLLVIVVGLCITLLLRAH